MLSNLYTSFQFNFFNVITHFYLKLFFYLYEFVDNDREVETSFIKILILNLFLIKKSYYVTIASVYFFHYMCEFLIFVMFQLVPTAESIKLYKGYISLSKVLYCLMKIIFIFFAELNKPLKTFNVRLDTLI